MVTTLSENATTRLVPLLSGPPRRVFACTVGTFRHITAFFRAFAVILAAVFQIVRDVIKFWLHSGVDSMSPMFVRRNAFLAQMAQAPTYKQWRRGALALDELEGNTDWKKFMQSPLYDYNLVNDRLIELFQARKDDDKEKMMFLLRSTLSRNLGGMGQAALYRHCHVGTKQVIEHYIDEVVHDLNYVSNTEISGIPHQQKVTLLAETRASFGRTALLLSGGGGLGIFHYGVIKALFDEDLLPRIISGSSAGALMASLVCTTPEPELRTQLGALVPQIRNTNFITREGDSTSFRAKLSRFLRFGSLAEVEVLQEALHANIGDITFQEAYALTNRILNITVNSPSMKDAPRLLNYLTAPNVVIWSAAAASCALSLLFEPVQIKVKTASGELVPWNPPDQKWSDGSVESDLPMQRLAELFNVNHFIVSQLNPHVLPFLRLSRALPQFTNAVAVALVHRMDQFASLGILPHLCRSIKTILTQRYVGHITIVPEIALSDYLGLLSNPTPDMYARALRIGQLATWPQLSIIANHLKIEMTLDRIVHRLRGVEKWQLG